MNDIQRHKQKLLDNIKLSEALTRLQVNTDFALVFKSYYCNELAIENTKALAYYDKDSLEYKELMNELNQISSFQKFMDTILSNGAMARDNLKELANLDTGDNDD